MKVGLLTIDGRECYKDYGTPQPYFGAAPQALLQGFAKLTAVEVHVVVCVTQPVAHTPKLAENISYHSLLVPGAWTRELYLRCILATRRKLQELKPDIVHGQGSERDCALAAVYSGFPNILTLHGNHRELARVTRAPLFSFLRFQAIIESWAVRRTAGVLCLTNHTREQVKDITPRTWVLPNAVDESFFSLNKRDFSANRDLICVARIDRNKNQNFLIRALDAIAEANGIRLVFLGGGDLADPYFREFQDLVKSRPWCAHLGFQDRQALAHHLLSARSLVLPSLEENCPMAILEAMAVGLPVAAARSGGIPDLVRPGETGFLFDSTDPQSARDAILKICRDDSMAAAMGQAGKQRALENHLPVRIAERHLDIYREALRIVS